MKVPSTHESLLLALQDDEHREEAWEAFNRRYRAVLLHWCQRRRMPPETAEDLTQDILLKLLRELPRGSYDPRKGRFSAWLKAVVNNALTDYWRRQREQLERGVGGSAFLRHLAGVAEPEAAEELSDDLARDAEDAAAETFRRVRERVKDTTWQAFFQSVVERRPAATVASELGISVLSVYKANYRIKRMLLKEYANVRPSPGGADPLPGSGDPPETGS